MLRTKPLRFAAIIALAGTAAIVVALIAACNADAERAQIQPTKRVVYMASVEPESTVSVDEVPFPTEPLPPGGGYELEEPDEEGMWTVEAYYWMPDLITVYEGDEVELHILGINGKEHPSFIDEYVAEFNVKKGYLTTLNFTANKAGVFRIVCTSHQPSMTGTLLVLPRP